MKKRQYENVTEIHKNFSNWQDSWEDNMERSNATKDFDELAIMDFERAEEKYNLFLSTGVRQVKDIDDRDFLDRLVAN